MALATACGPTVEPGVTVLVTAEVAPLVQDGLAFVGDSGLRAVVVADPVAELKRRGGAVVALSTRDDCTECFRVDGQGTLLSVSGGAPLGVQYGLWHALELMGYRFLHPYRSVVPKAPQPAPTAALGVEHLPEVKKRRGLHLHTLHPTESLYDFWLPGEKNLEGGEAHRRLRHQEPGQLPAVVRAGRHSAGRGHAGCLAGPHPRHHRLRARPRGEDGRRVAAVWPGQPAERLRPHRRRAHGPAAGDAAPASPA